MKPTRTQECAVAAFFLLTIGSPFIHAAAAQPSAPPTDQRVQPGSAVSTVVAPVYRPPVRGAPGGRVGGGTRGGDQTFTLSVLAPNHTALTMQEQPTLYWFVSKPITTPVVFTLSDDGEKPLVEQTLTPPFDRGIHRLSLADFGAKLSAGRQYRWFVSLVGDPKRRSRDILAGATIERTTEQGSAVPDSHLDSGEQARQHAASGQWYDAIAVLSHLIDSHPTDGTYRSQRAGLLQQVGLVEIADFDLSQRVQ